MKISRSTVRILQIVLGITVLPLFILYSKFIHEATDISKMNPLHLSGLPRIPKSSIDFGRRNNVMWPSDQECKRYSVHFGKNMTFVYLASFPRSGNTWSRYLIEAASGIFTGTVYIGETPTLELNFFGSGENPFQNSTIIVKTHYHWNVNWPPTFAMKRPVVLLIRQPERAVISYWNYENADKSKKFFFEVPNSSYSTREFHEFVKRMTENWSATTLSYIKNAKKLLVIFYEDILKDPIREVKKVMEFLGYEADPGRLECLRKYPEGHAKRKHKEIDPYTQEEKFMFALNMHIIMKALKERGIEVPEVYSDYFNKFFQIKR